MPEEPDHTNTSASSPSSAARDDVPSSDAAFRRAVDAVRRGETEKARRMLWSFLERDRDHEQAWVWLAMTYPSDAERLRILQYYLDRHPQSDLIGRAVVALLERVERKQASELAESSPLTAAADLAQPAEMPVRYRLPDDTPPEFLPIEDYPQHPGADVPKIAPDAEQGQPGASRADQADEVEEGISETTLILISVVVIVVTIILALLWSLYGT